ncbi:hypothetical protein J4G37_62650, partial [Microvirga sp. 3-52]|nr:hypothetical protein [Microvirga sp. 3-52]
MECSLRPSHQGRLRQVRYSSHASRTFDGTNHHDDVSDGAGTGATVGTLAGRFKLRQNVKFHNGEPFNA